MIVAATRSNYSFRIIKAAIIRKKSILQVTLKQESVSVSDSINATDLDTVFSFYPVIQVRDVQLYSSVFLAAFQQTINNLDDYFVSAGERHYPGRILCSHQAFTNSYLVASR